MRRLLLTTTLAALPFVALACSSKPPACDDPTSTTTVDMQDSAFQPACVATEADATLQLVNHDDTTHTFTVRGTDVDVKVEGGQTADASLAAVPTGTYEVFCLYHPEMKETLQISSG